MEDVAGFFRRRTARALQLRLHAIEPRVEDVVVDARERVDAAQVARGGWRGRREERQHADERCDDRRRAASRHVRLVRSCCFSACRSSARLTSRSRSAGYSTPDAAHSFEYMLIVVKPGIVFTSLT